MRSCWIEVRWPHRYPRKARDLASGRPCERLEGASFNKNGSGSESNTAKAHYPCFSFLIKRALVNSFTHPFHVASTKKWLTNTTKKSARRSPLVLARK